MGKSIQVYCKKNGKLYISGLAAERDLGLPRGYVSKGIYGRLKRVQEEYQFAFVNDDGQIELNSTSARVKTCTGSDKSNKSKPVRCKSSGMEFSSMKEAGLYYGVAASTVRTSVLQQRPIRGTDVEFEFIRPEDISKVTQKQPRTPESLRKTPLQRYVKEKLKLLKELSVHLSDKDIEKLYNAKSEIHVDAIARDLILR